ncbi:ATP-binding protein [Pseudonocardia sp. CA-107938]|uniref:ATP-binding protein n=1 Tax=Pseudonocardia sp. CA-107938 TaxID=3240021 RepID=UPI003D8C0FF0
MSDERPGGAAAMLPAATTRFVGRRHESRDVRRLLENARLVTLTGVGGVGKTRLALHVAEEVRRAFADGVWFVELAVLTSGDRIADAVGTALGITDRSTRPALDKIVEHLRSRQVLLVIDNCEHVATEAARFVDRVLRMTTQVRVLATSRHTLGVDGEHVFDVPTLAVPDPHGVHGAAVACRFDAVRLLSDRAAAIHPGFAVTDGNATSVTRLCAQLDGLPLAIELAATRLRSLSVDQVVERLEHRFALLTGGSSAAQPRQRTLRAMVDWSHSLCSPAQRTLWARLSVFAGSFDLTAAEAVCADADPVADGGLAAGDVLDLLDDLVAQSIVLADRDSGAGVRFRLLETIRQYGREQLAQRAETDALVKRHRDHYVDVVETVAARWCSGHQEADLARLRADRGNLASALESATSGTTADPRAALRLAAGLRPLWYADEQLSDGRHWCDAALALPRAADPLRVRALWVAAWVSLLQGDESTANARLGECEQLAARLGDEPAVAHAMSLRATAALFRGELDTAADLFAAALDRMERLNDLEGLVWGLFQQAITLAHRGERDVVVDILNRSLEISERHGELLCRSYTLWVLGFSAWRRGDTAVASRRVCEGLTIQSAFNDSVGAALMIDTLAWIAASAGDMPLAASRLAAAHAAWTAAGTSIAAFGPPLLVHHDAAVAAVQAAGRSIGAAPGTGGPATVAQIIAGVLGRPATPRDAEPPVALTARELQVAELVAAGMSNREVAARLVLSPRTVDGHLERILAKLDFTSRTQIAGWVAERRIASGNR